MFKPRNMSSNNLTHHNKKWPNHSISKEKSKEDSTEGSEVKEEDLAMEEDKVVNQSSATPVGYLGITRGSVVMCNAHTVQPVIIMLKVDLS